MTNPPSFATLPTLIYREIAHYLSLHVNLRCDIPSYLTLQQCCNPLFAHEVRSTMKEKLQHIQANLALLKISYALDNLHVLKIPLYIHDLTFSDVYKAFDTHFILNSISHSNRPFPKHIEFLFGYIQAKCRDLEPFPGLERVSTPSHILDINGTLLTH
ncbi:hypothetical protein HK097_010683, partial [Rhizophlyctis rosea]